MTAIRLDPEMVAAWADVVNDHNPLHLDPAFAARTRFGHPIVHGSLLVALLCDAASTPLPPLRIRFRAPIPVGSTVDIPDGLPQLEVTPL
ncbi:MaoC/PaaZ C-terminal domain-containing protein [Micromonospora sp. 4G57]|uniref:MaoC/PaaZ C-terminal domain-containing protein n=1 Tax=Micromonospora sicca TaxID=2202420 RepID=A0ABU5JLJ8_9ACTN|nr:MULTISPECIES: MaoC/PaaZ C-terminal domain-containing protein [unclassified Micromonospora]MDZ5446360.1 MaoC/PaaZ C-terminal domain-containing protein [Micromonospora sp. 4G57]MDZ5493451.1 MaoC/PaaZ C-terminal domain-containing protein [Micromonospora sp. 4G53]